MGQWVTFLASTWVTHVSVVKVYAGKHFCGSPFRTWLAVSWIWAPMFLHMFLIHLRWVSHVLVTRQTWKKKIHPIMQDSKKKHTFFKSLLAIVFRNIPWAKASPIDEPRVRKGVCLRFFAFHVLQPGIWLPEMPTWLINPPFKGHFIQRTSLNTRLELASWLPTHQIILFLSLYLYLNTYLSFAPPTKISDQWQPELTCLVHCFIIPRV